jgi:sarcosine oxidase subunit beta
MINKADIVIIGGGVIGLSIAYNILKLDKTKKVVVLEKDYICSGSTGRCGGGIRQQWTTKMNIELAINSVKIFENLHNELEYETEFQQGGYLLLAHTKEKLDEFKKNVKLQRECSLDVELIEDLDRIKEIAPHISLENIIGATYCKTDGTANPFLITYGYLKKFKEFGGTVYTDTKVTEIKMNNNEIKEVITNRGKIKTQTVINAAGGFSKEICDMVNFEIPTKSYRHQIFVTEKLPKIQNYMIIDFEKNFYISQSLHGGFITGQSDYDEKPSNNTNCNWQFAGELSKKLIKRIPMLKDVNIIRTWAGSYNVSPDSQPIIGKIPNINNMFTAVGFSGHGFMLAPMVAKCLSELILFGKYISLDISYLGFDRLNELKNLTEEKNVV